VWKGVGGVGGAAGPQSGMRACGGAAALKSVAVPCKWPMQSGDPGWLHDPFTQQLLEWHIDPVLRNTKDPPVGTKVACWTRSYVAWLIWMQPCLQVDSMRLAVFLRLRSRWGVVLNVREKNQRQAGRFRGAGTEALQCIEAREHLPSALPATHPTPPHSCRAATAPTHMVSPNTLYLGSLVPMSPVTAGPVCMPTRIWVGSPLCGMRTVFAHRRMACVRVHVFMCACVFECVRVCAWAC